MLNKRTGCKSRTVPPLCVPEESFFGESRSLGKPGKAERFVEKLHKGMSQKTYEEEPSAHRGTTVCALSQKNGCGAFFAPQP